MKDRKKHICPADLTSESVTPGSRDKSGTAPVVPQDGTQQSEASAHDPRAAEPTRAQPSAEFFRRLFDTSIDGILQTAPDGRTFCANEAACAMLGHSEEDLRLIGRAGVTRRADPNAAAMLKARQSNGRVRQEVELVRGDGTTFPCEVSSCIYTDSDGQSRAIVILRDVTEQRNVEKQVLEAVMREKRQLAMELHDGLGQQLTGLSLLVTALARDVERARIARLGQDLAELAGLVRDCISTTRAIAQGLSPVDLAGGGLASALRRVAEFVERLSGIGVVIEMQGIDENSFEPAFVDSVYLIAREAMVNAARHSGASRIALEAELTGTHLIIAVTDNGRGFSRPLLSNGLGVNIMKYRARTLGGHIELETPPSGGTTVRLVCPCGS